MYYFNKVYREDLKTIIKDNNIIELKNSNILITGASGMIGSVIVDTLLLNNELFDSKITVFALGRNKQKLNERFISHLNNPYIKTIAHDINNPLSIETTFDYIIHAASNAYPKAFSSDPIGTMMTNINGVNNLLEYGEKNNLKRFLFVSSGEVYGQGDKNQLSFDEDYCGYIDSTNPRSCYPNGKRAAETLCASYLNKYGLETVIARPCHTYGATATSKDNRAASQFINNILQDKDIVMKSDGFQLRSYCYVSDCVSGLFTILLKGEVGNAYNIANKNSNVTIRKIAQTLASSNNKEIIFENPSDKEKSSYNPVSQSVLNANKLEQLNWNARYDINSGLERTISILKEKN
jgi:nucleoside-diphosphate-sugar epimerase